MVPALGSPTSPLTPSQRILRGTRARLLAADTVKEIGTRMSELHRGWSLEHGFLTFQGPDMERSIKNVDAATFVQAQQGAFLKLSGEAELSTPFTDLPNVTARQRRVCILLGLLGVIENEWGMSMPPMIVSVTGNAAPFELRPKFNKIFNQALLKATASTGAWVTTGGTDAGVMKAAGNAMKNSLTPVVGISSWGIIKGRAPLSRPAQAIIRKRIRQQIADRNQTVSCHDIATLGTI